MDDIGHQTAIACGVVAGFAAFMTVTVVVLGILIITGVL